MLWSWLIIYCMDFCDSSDGNDRLKWDASIADSVLFLCLLLFFIMSEHLLQTWNVKLHVDRQCSRWVWIWFCVCSEILMQRWCDSSAWAGHLATRVSHRVLRSWHCPEAISFCTPRETFGVYKAETTLEGNKEMLGLRLLQATVKRIEDPLELKEIVFFSSCALNRVSLKPKMQMLSLAPSPLHPSLKKLYTLMGFLLELLSWHSV